MPTRLALGWLAALLIAAAACVPPASAASSRQEGRLPSAGGPGGQCSAPADRVVITVVAGPREVRAAAAGRPGAKVASRDAETVVFADGRVVTARLDRVGKHLNALGWADRELVISNALLNNRGASGLRRRG